MSAEVIFDVVSLYTNMEKDFGIKAVQYWPDKHPNDQGRFSDSYICAAITIILENYIFQFDNKY